MPFWGGGGGGGGGNKTPYVNFSLRKIFDPANVPVRLFASHFVYACIFVLGRQLNTSGPFYYYGLTLILACIINHMPNKVWGEITYLFPNLSGPTVEVWEWISNFFPHIIMDVITYPFGD